MIPEWNSFINADCMEYLKEFPDDYFDLAIVDPPYGAGLADNGGCKGWFEKYHQSPGNADFVERERERERERMWSRFGQRFARYASTVYTDGDKYRTGGQRHFTNGRRKKLSTYKEFNESAGEANKKIVSWDIAPEREYFEELFRISRNQIIWGGNYFELPPTRCFVIWEKTNISENFSMAMCEYAWTSFQSNAKIWKHTSIRDNTSGKFHPTEKPIALYQWLLQQYAKDGDKILDTHVGSASSLIACRNTKHDYIGFELDPEYYKKAKERLETASAQVNIFDFI